MDRVTGFQLSAALWVIRAIDERGSNATTLDAAFHGAVTLGRFPRPDLDNALRLLRGRDLLVAEGGLTRHNGTVLPLLMLPDESALPLLAELLAVAERDDEDENADRTAALGAIGEEAVVAWCTDELQQLARIDLVDHVQRVSLISDRFGFDVSAPSIHADSRMLEVKTTFAKSGKTFRFFLTRNEYEVGRRHSSRWALVACRADEAGASVIGWCRASELERYLPDDANGRWTEALVHLPVSALLPGAPSAVP